MSLNADRSRLMAIAKEISLQWEAAQDSWKDGKSQEFDRKYMEQLLLHIEKAVAVCEKLDKIITKVRSDCE